MNYCRVLNCLSVRLIINSGTKALEKCLTCQEPGYSDWPISLSFDCLCRGRLSGVMLSYCDHPL